MPPMVLFIKLMNIALRRKTPMPLKFNKTRIIKGYYVFRSEKKILYHQNTIKVFLLMTSGIYVSNNSL